MAHSGLTLHALDTASGKPAAGLGYTVFRIAGDARTALAAGETNSDGRCGAPMLTGGALTAGIYEVLFDVAGWRGGESGFYDLVPIRFRVADAGLHYHIPLLISPFGYTTYRGS
jgi:5-hydroxyisourate hydrolase